MLCEKCQQREATCHINICSGSPSDDVQKTSDLCSECFEASHPMARGIAAAMQAGCRYCGGAPSIGSGDPIATLSGIRKMSTMCKPCARESFRFVGEKMPGFGEAPIRAELLAKIHSYDIPGIFFEAEEHLKKRVADRGPE